MADYKHNMDDLGKGNPSTTPLLDEGGSMRW